ncbi:hypothetical protein EHQ68_13320 [Leptospira congkakensis]|uniref:Uncharacterized protein n=1 Tax=Leptospira congkakensis TaxID=2484932 RepID=A0A4Z1A5X5_9LEPT|nr:hypothetical protein [Leptospira congkakensis]TGL86301.1 hypothetical protein EHQ68_13320 [Leptospira congkakensis]TGL94154.1 hypothetical protein EHQ69_06710 [Leptospira congkakensis]TGL94438.1 hypothetical protein EHQ70_14080 [Leptospira congkakensis]
MKRKIVIFFLLTGIVFSANGCKKESTEDSETELLGSILSQGSAIQAACQRFILSESNCVAASDSSSNVCSGLISNLKREILPQELSTDSVAILYFDCFTKTNYAYNFSKACSQNSFNSNSDYRRVQRVGTSQAEISWRVAFNKCGSLENEVPPSDSGIAETNTMLRSDPF